MTQKDIETLSVNAVRDSIVMSSYLDQFITDNDKEPSWDGHVYIYDNESKTKAALTGRVPVQVKGTINNDFSKTEISYQISSDDLKGYLYNGGAIVFVVYIRENDYQKKIYYAELSPIKLRSIITEIKNQQTKSIKLKEFPLDGDEKATLFLNFYLHCQRQSSFANAKLFTVEELEKQGVFEGISVFASGYGLPYNNPTYALLNTPIYLYANTKGSSIPQPLEVIPVEFEIEEQENHIISINDIVYYNSFTRIRNKNHVTIKIGDSLFIQLKKEKEKINRTIKYTNSKKLFSIIKDLDFFLAVINSGGFKIDGYEVPINTQEVNSTNFDIVKEKERLNYLEKVGQIFNLFGLKDEIDIDNLSDKDWKNINILKRALIDKVPVSGLIEDIPPITSIDVSGYTFALIFEHYKGLPDTYTILDLFKTEINLSAVDEDGAKYKVPTCAILKPEDFLNISNIRLDALLPSYRELNTPNSRERANWTLLHLLSAYDMSKATRPELLRTAKAFAKWLDDFNDDVLPSELTVLNLLQTIKRERDLSKEEKKKLYSITEDSLQEKEYVVGAHLLLGNQVAAEMNFENLEPKAQEAFKNYPIYHFWKTE